MTNLKKGDILDYTKGDYQKGITTANPRKDL